MNHNRKVLQSCSKSNSMMSLLFIIGIGFFDGYCKSKIEIPEDEIVVRVGSQTLTLNELAAAIPPALGKNVDKGQIQDYVLRWINSEVLYQEALRQELDQNPDIEKELNRLRRDLLVSRLISKKLDNHKLTIYESQIEEYYSTNKASFTRNEPEVYVFHIHVRSKRTADSLYQALRGRGDFVNIAKQISFNTKKETPWKLYLAQSEVPKMIGKLFRMAPGATSKPIELDDGYHIFKLAEKYKNGSIRKLELVRDEITEKIQTRLREEKYKILLSELRSSSRIETNFQMLESIPVDSIVARSHTHKQIGEKTW